MGGVGGKRNDWKIFPIGPLHNLVTWYGINYAGTQVTRWEFQNKGKSDWTGRSSFVLKVPLCNLCPSIINFIPCDQIVQRTYFPCIFGLSGVDCMSPWSSVVVRIIVFMCYFHNMSKNDTTAVNYSETCICRHQCAAWCLFTMSSKRFNNS